MDVVGGNISLASTSPFDAPVIDPALLGTPLDLAIMRESIKTARKYVATSAFSGYIVSEYGALAEAQTDEELDAFIRDQSDTVDHPVGTVAMGKGKDGALDANLRVKGAKGLRVVDASAFVSHAHSLFRCARSVLICMMSCSPSSHPATHRAQCISLRSVQQI